MKGLKILISMLALALLLGTTAFAAGNVIMQEEFDDDSLSGWTVTKSGTAEISAADGLLTVSANGTADGVHQARRNLAKNTSASVFEIKLMVDIAADNQSFSMSYYNGEARAFIRIQKNAFMMNTSGDALKLNLAHESGVWYTYYIRQSEGGKIVDLYRRAGDGELETLATNVELQANTATRLDLFIEKSAGVSAKIDYVRIYGEGLHIFKKQLQSGGEEATAIPNGEISAVCDMAYMGSGTQTATVILAVFDANSMIRKLQTASISFDGSDSRTAQLSCNLADIYKNLSGGSCELYVWDSVEGMQPLCSLYALK